VSEISQPCQLRRKSTCWPPKLECYTRKVWFESMQNHGQTRGFEENVRIDKMYRKSNARILMKNTHRSLSKIFRSPKTQGAELKHNHVQSSFESREKQGTLFSVNGLLGMLLFGRIICIFGQGIYWPRFAAPSHLSLRRHMLLPTSIAYSRFATSSMAISMAKAHRCGCAWPCIRVAPHPRPILPYSVE